MDYQSSEIEQKWRQRWEAEGTYKVSNDSDRPKYYVLDMFPYPSGAGLHVGHPLGYIASDIYARYKRLQGFNVLHPMGYDSFGLPAEQYAIQTGIHPAVATEENINRYRQQLENLGFSFDWSREVRTSDTEYYRWTQWIFQQLFKHYYDNDADKAMPITDLISRLATEGNAGVNAACEDDVPIITADEWKAMSERDQQLFLLNYRLTYPAESFVNWCPALGTVLSNDEVKDGLSERGGHPVERKMMAQWSMRITAYNDRLIDGLDDIDWPASLKEQQRNWIGRSYGASVKFPLQQDTDITIEVFTTRVDTIFGVSFMVLAPEHELVNQITTPEQEQEVTDYQDWAASRSDVVRMAEVKKVTGAFTGAYCNHPFTNEPVPIYISDYVLAGYGTGAVMAVPSGDQRDWDFATHFGLPIIPILDAQQNIETEADATKEGKYINSGMINGMTYEEAIPALTAWLEERGLGKGKIQYRMRNAVFSRQRYWGEPVPAYWKDDVPYLIEEDELPLVLPAVDKYLPTETGEPPLGRATDWKYEGKYEYELSTMPGWAGSSWYWYRYMDPNNTDRFASKEAIDYWQDVDLYVGGSEHATGHLLYSRFWNHFLYDLGLVPKKEYARKLINQGMIQGVIEFLKLQKNKVDGYSRFVCADIAKQEETEGVEFAQIPIHIDYVQEYGSNASHINIDSIKKFVDWRPEYNNAIFECGSGTYHNGVFTPKGDATDSHLMTVSEVGKMSKRYFNVVNPDDVVARYGADCFRMYEMFLGPLEQAKPWNTSSINGVSRFLNSFWRLFYDKDDWAVTDEAPNKDEMKVLHAAIKKVTEDIERFSFNTGVSAFMVATNELGRLKCSKRAILEPLLILMAPYAVHLCEELWENLGNTGSIHHAAWPALEEKWLIEENVTYPIAINGKTRATVDFPADATKADLEAAAPDIADIQRHLEGKTIRKIIVVPGRMINIVVG